jgi:hypothetical protein
MQLLCFEVVTTARLRGGPARGMANAAETRATLRFCHAGLLLGADSDLFGKSAEVVHARVKRRSTVSPPEQASSNAVGSLALSVYVRTVRLNASGQAARMHDLEMVRRLGMVRWPHSVAADPRVIAVASLPICQRSFNRQSTAFVMRGLSVRLRPLAL